MAAGAEAILSIHISEKLSRTCASARLAAEQMPIPVYVLDSRSIAMAVGYMAVAAAEAALAGAAPQEVLEAAERRRASAAQYFYVDTLEYLRRGGRIGKAAALLGAALELKPLLTLEDGQIAPIARVRKAERAITRLEEVALQAAGAGPVDVAVHHVAAPDGAEALSRRLRERVPAAGEWHVNPASWVLGVHGGPGVLGIVVSPR
jgi:DegV family protein with EDD domain